MRRQILTYLPAQLVPAFIMFAMIYAYTRLLGVAAYGDYSLAFTGVVMAQTAIFVPLQASAVRLYPAAERDGRLPAFLLTLYACLGLIAVAGFVLAFPVLGAVSWLQGGLPMAMAIAVPLFLFRGLIAVAQGINRMSDRHVLYVTTECAHAALGLAAGLAFVAMLPPGSRNSAAAVMGGLLVASLVCALTSVLSQCRAIRQGRFDRAVAVELSKFAAPLALVLLTTIFLQYADRFVIGAMSGAAAVGIYAVAFALVERPTTILCMSIATATYPLAVRELERHGVDAGRLQAGRNGAVLLAIIVPACLGLALTAGHFSAVLVGPDYRAGAAALIPIMAFRALARGVSQHFVEHSFYLARRPDLLVRIYGPAAVLNILVDFAAVPVFGMLGAAWTALIFQVAALCACWVIGRHLFPLSLPRREAASVLAAAAVMGCALLVTRFPMTPIGLALMIGTGALAYGATLLPLVGRATLQSVLRRSPVPAPSPLQAGQ